MRPKQANNSPDAAGQWHTTLDARGRITIPTHIRRQFGLRAGDTCAFTALGDGTISLRFFRRRKKGRWLDILARQVVARLPEWRDRPSGAKSSGHGYAGARPLGAAPSAAPSLGHEDRSAAYAPGRFTPVAGDILRNDFFLPLALSAKKIARAVCRDRKSAAAFAERLDDFMANSEWALDLDDCLRLDRFFGLGDGYFWRAIGADEVRGAVIEHAEALSRIKPLLRTNPSKKATAETPGKPTLVTQSQARLLLPTLIGRLSLDIHDRGWMTFLPFTLWESVIGKPSESFREEDVTLFRQLSEIAGGWARFDEKEGPRFVACDAWDEEFSKWKSHQSSRDSQTAEDWSRARERMRSLVATRLKLPTGKPGVSPNPLSP